ncbi:probable polygalacturonase At3g15720 [Fagus crenata]
MQELLRIVLILSLSSTCLCHGLVNNEASKVLNVLNHGAVGDGETDDSQAFLEAWKSLCEVEAAYVTPMLVVPEGKKFLLKPVIFQGPCKSDSVHVQVLGTLLAPDTMEGWINCPSHCWLRFSNVSNLIVSGSGEINGRGSIWWNQSYVQALHFHKCNNLHLRELIHRDSPKNHISIDSCNGATLSYLHISAPEKSPNTDGVDISSSTFVSIHDSYIGTGDDCIAINGNTAHINITRVSCGPGHGISVGSLGAHGAHETVEEVYVQNCNFTGTMNGARIKTWQGGSGYARNILFEQIQFMEVKNPIIIDQFYCNGGHNCKNMTSSVQVSNVTYRGIEGTSASHNAIALNCDEIKCTNIVMDRINITSSIAGNPAFASCNNAEGKSSCTTPEVSCLTSDKKDCDSGQ